MGLLNPNGYTTKFIPESIDTYSDFTAGTYSMAALSAGTDDIISESGVTIAAATSVTITAASYTNLTVTYVQGATTTADIYYQTADQSASVVEGYSLSVTPDLS